MLSSLCKLCYSKRLGYCPFDRQCEFEEFERKRIEAFRLETIRRRLPHRLTGEVIL